LGLGLGEFQISNLKFKITKEVQALLNKREELRSEGKFAQADAIRDKLKKEHNYEARDKSL